MLFSTLLEVDALPLACGIVNRVHHALLGDREPRELSAALARALPSSLAGRVADNFRDYHVLARRDDQNLARLAAQLDDRRLLLVPQLDDDVHDIEGLARVHRYLFASQAERQRLIDDLVA